MRLQGVELAAQDPVFLAFRQEVANLIQDNPAVLATIEASTDPVALASLLKTLAQNIASPRLYEQQQTHETAWNDPAALAARIAELAAPPPAAAPTPGAPAPPRSQGPSTVPAGELSDSDKRERTIAAALAAHR